jgi:DNA-binding protein HU-beta
MARNDLVKAVVEETGITRAAADKAITATFDTILAGVLGGGKICIQGFGPFDLKESAAREGRNPATGAPLTIAAKKTVRFKFSKSNEDKINGN